MADEKPAADDNSEEPYWDADWPPAAAAMDTGNDSGECASICVHSC